MKAVWEIITVGRSQTSRLKEHKGAAEKVCVHAFVYVYMNVYVCLSMHVCVCVCKILEQDSRATKGMMIDWLDAKRAREREW